MKEQKQTKAFLFLTILFILATTVLSGCHYHIYPTSQKGIIDLSNGELDYMKTIHLDGEWEIYWNIPEAPPALPDNTNKEYIFLPGLLKSDGHGPWKKNKSATCRLLIKLPESGGEYGLVIPRFIGTQSVWINGKLYKSYDHNSTHLNKSGTYQRKKSIFFQAESNEIELILHSTNFFLHGGGHVNNIILGKKDQLILSYRRSRGFKFIFVGSLLMMALYHLGFYLLQHKEKSVLFFALFNIFICLRTMIAGDNIFLYLLPQTYNLFIIKLEFISVVFLAIFNLLFFYHLFEDLASSKIVTVLILLYSLQGIATALSPIRFIFRITNFHIIVTPLVFIYIIYITIKAISNKKEGSLLFLSGNIFLFLCALWDILKGLQLHHSINLLPVGFVIFCLFQSILLGKRLIKAFAIIESFSARLEIKVAERTLELEKTHSKVMESINYARTIQLSILPRQSLLAENFSDFFVLWNPREIVGGDLYWFKKRGDEYLLALLDCTGHGVPGALMTMTVNSILSNITDSVCFSNPARILQYLNTNLRSTLQKDSDQTLSDDGLDIGIIYYGGPGKKLIFSGAKISLFYLETANDGVRKLVEVSPDKQSIGYRDSDNTYEYTNYEIETSAGNQFYLTTDGLIDQCGGSNGLPFGKKKFKELIESNGGFIMSQQESALRTALIEYRNSGDPAFPQLDDVTILGFKI